MVKTTIGIICESKWQFIKQSLCIDKSQEIPYRSGLRPDTPFRSYQFFEIYWTDDVTVAYGWTLVKLNQYPLSASRLSGNSHSSLLIIRATVRWCTFLSSDKKWFVFGNCPPDCLKANWPINIKGEFCTRLTAFDTKWSTFNSFASTRQTCIWFAGDYSNWRTYIKAWSSLKTKSL